MTALRPVASVTLPVLLLLAAMFSIQVGASMAKSLFPVVGALGATSLRLGFGTLLLWLVLRPWRMPWRTLPWKMLLGYGVSLGVMNTLFYLALQTVPLGIAIALEFTGPLGLALLGARRPRDVAWVALAVAGLLLLVPWSSQQEALDPLGVAYALGAGLCWALYIVFGQKAGAEHGPQGRCAGRGDRGAGGGSVGRAGVRHGSAGASAAANGHRRGRAVDGAALQPGNDGVDPIADQHVRHADEP